MLSTLKRQQRLLHDIESTHKIIVVIFFLIKVLCDKICLIHISIAMNIFAIFTYLQNHLAPLLYFHLK